MDNAFDELTRALDIARMVKRAAENNANSMADLLDGSLRSVSEYRLARLKKELRKFNIHTGRWSKE